MQRLSESLMDLARRVKRLEDSAAAVQQKNRAALQARRDELETTIDREVDQLHQATAQAKGNARTWWSETRTSIEQQIAHMRADFQKWRDEMKEKNAERAAEDAEADAAMAVDLAAYCLDAAEWAVVRAELSRGEADRLVKGG